MKKIEKLTAAQIATFPRYVAEWTGYGLCTAPADRPRAEAAIEAIYRTAGMAAPKVVWCGSPLSMALTRAAVDSVGDSVQASVRDSVWSSIGASVRDSVRASVWDSVWDSVQASVRDSVWESCFGQHDAAGLAFFSFFRNELGLVAETDPVAGLSELCKCCGWIMPYANICFASERHDICRLDENNRIHSEIGPAIHYPDGFEIHAWHGTRIPARWIEDRQSLTAEEVLACEDVEQRAAGFDIIGPARMLNSLRHEIVDDDPDSERGSLIRLWLDGLPEPALYLKFVCPRNGEMMEAVDEDRLEALTLHAAHAQHANIPARLFTFAQQRS